MKTHTLEAGQFVDFILKHEDDVNCENTIFSTTALTQRRWVESREETNIFFAFIGNCLNCNYQCNDHIFINDHHLHVSLLLLLLSSSSSLFIYLFTYFFTLTVLHFFWCFLAKRCCTKWAWDAGNLGLLILVLVHCTCTTAGSIEKVATRTVN